MEILRTVQIEQATLIRGDSLRGMSSLPDQSFDLAVVDPPYNASTRADWHLKADHNLERFGGAWQLASHEWDQFAPSEYFRFTLEWLTHIRRLVKPTGSAWIHATYHNAGFVNVACQMLELEIINEVIWFKRNAFPNMARRRLTASHESIYWIHTGRGKRAYRFNYDQVKAAVFAEDRIKEKGKQLRTVWDIPNNKDREEIKYGSHPTQKPLRLLDRMLLVSGLVGGKILDPFMGRGSVEVAALRYGMIPTGFETDEAHFNAAIRRVREETEQLSRQPKLDL